MHGEKIKLS